MLASCIPITIPLSKHKGKSIIFNNLSDIVIVGGNLFYIVDRKKKDWINVYNYLDKMTSLVLQGFEKDQDIINKKLENKLKIKNLKPLNNGIEIVLVGGDDFVFFADLIGRNKNYDATIYISANYASVLIGYKDKLILSLLTHEIAHILLGDEGDIIKGPVAIACMAATASGVGAVAMLPLALLPPRVMGEEMERKVENYADYLAINLVKYCGLTANDYILSLRQLSRMISLKEKEAQQELKRRIKYVSENS